MNEKGCGHKNSYLYIVWKDVQTRRQYIIGKLEKCNGYNFYYYKEIEAALKAGFSPFVAFPDVHRKYHSDNMFLPFSSRLPDKKRKDMNIILERYNLKEYDEYELLKKSRGKLPIDNIQFIDPLFVTDEEFEKCFFLAGVRHYLHCDGKNCSNSIDIVRGDELFLQPEPDNKEDECAVKVVNKNCECIGYIPRYYAESYNQILQQKRVARCYVASVNKNNNCDDCVKINILVSAKI